MTATSVRVVSSSSVTLNHLCVVILAEEMVGKKLGSGAAFSLAARLPPAVPDSIVARRTGGGEPFFGDSDECR